MPITLVQKASIGDIDSLTRDFKVWRVWEMDASAWECRAIGLDVPSGRFRVMVVGFVDRNDANHMRKITKVLGPASGQMSLVIPCDDSDTEWAQIVDLMAYRAQKLTARIKARDTRLQANQVRWNREITELAYELMARKAGKSTFGAGVTTGLQRSS